MALMRLKKMAFLTNKDKKQKQSNNRTARTNPSSSVSSFKTIPSSSSSTDSSGQNLDVPVNKKVPKKEHKKTTRQQQQQQRPTLAASKMNAVPMMNSTYSLTPTVALGLTRGISEHLENFYLYDYDDMTGMPDGYDVNEELRQEKLEQDEYSLVDHKHHHGTDKKQKVRSTNQVAVKPEEQCAPIREITAPAARTSSSSNKESGNAYKNNTNSKITELPAGDPSFATPELTRTLVRKFISDIWNRGELELIPEVCSPRIRYVVYGSIGLNVCP
jgi:hypothetical protein